MKTWRIRQNVLAGAVFVLGLALFSGCGDHGHDHAGALGTAGAQSTAINEAEPAGGHAHEEGPHGGELLDAGTHDIHLELVHSHGEAKAVFHLMGPDAKTPLDADGDLAVNLMTGDGPKRITARPVEGASCFEVADPLLADECLNGQVEVTVKSKTYYVPLPDHHHEGDAGHEDEGSAKETHDEEASHNHEDGEGHD